MSTFTSNSEKNDESVAVSFEKKVLGEVRKAKSLYCSNDPNYNNMAKNRLEWLMIAEKCNKTVSECVKIWHSLLRIYFSSSPQISWVHIDDFLAFEPYLSSHKLHTPSKAQKNQLLKELWINSSDLHKPESTPEDRQKIWFKIVAKCNAITPGVIMSNINWQKYWVFMKQNFGERLYVIRSRHFEKSTSYTEKYSEEEMMIVQICQCQPWDPMADIVVALGNNSELGMNTELFLLKCKKCLIQRDEILYNGCCSHCCEKPIFCNICEIGGASVKYKLADWSKPALWLLPNEIASSEEISLCNKCSDDINKKASLEWKICRVCESSNPFTLESLYSCKSSLAFRKAFMETVKYEFQEKDGLPGYICLICKEQINRINKYIEKFKETQNRLMYIHKTNFIGNPEVKPLNQPKKQKCYADEMVIFSGKSKQPGIINKPAVEAKPKIVRKYQRRKIIFPEELESNKIIPQEKLESNKIIPQEKLESNKIIPQEKPESKTTTTVDTLAIKDVFSLQQRNLANKKKMPGAVLQAGKLDSSRIVNATKVIPPHLILNPKLINTSLSSPKTLNIFPKRTITNRDTTLPSPGLIIGKPQKLITLMRKSEPNITMKLKPTTASKPAIFTIPLDAPLAPLTPLAPPEPVVDYETIEDAPPVFCIPKNVIKSDNLPSDADKQLMDFTPSPSKVIKIEKPDDDHDYYPAKDIPTATSDVPLVESTENIKTPPEECDPNESSNLNPNNTRIVRIKGELVTIKPHPYLPGMYVPVEYHGKNQPSGTGGSIQLKPPVIRKVNPAKNTMHIAKPINISPNIPARITMIPETAEQQGIKKSRRYWGNVDGFQVALSTANAVKIIRLCDKNGVCTSSVDPSIQNSANVKIKEEFPYKDETSDVLASYQSQNLIFDSNTTNNTLSKHLKHTSSFKLKKLSINIKRDKRIQMMSSKFKELCLMQSVEEIDPSLSTSVVSFTRGRPRGPTFKQIKSTKKDNDFY